MNKNKTIILLVIGILVITTMSIGVTYSYMKNKTSGNNQTEIGINNCAKITLKENNSILNLTNMYPMEEEMGLLTEAYEFTISSTCEEYTGFNLYLTTLTDNQIEDNQIRYAVTDEDDNVLMTDLLTNKEEANDLTEEEIKELEQGLDNKRNKTYKVFNNNLYIKEEKTYKLHLWVDENADNETMKQNFKIKVSIKGYNWDGTITNYLITNRNNSLLYHNGTIKIDNQVMDAEDYSYRYAGSNEKVNNYVCFGGDCSSDSSNPNYANLYRIIGLFPTDETHITYEIKIIKAAAATSDQLGTDGAYYVNERNMPYYYWNSSTNVNNWAESNLNIENLNGYYLNEYLYPKDDQKWFNMIEGHTWITEGNTWYKITTQNAKTAYENEIKNPYVGTSLPTAAKTYNAMVGLMYVSDYMYGASKENWVRVGLGISESETVNDYRATINDNWLILGLGEWTITRTSERSDAINSVYGDGHLNVNSGDATSVVRRPARPCVYLKSNVKLSSGSGTRDDPYIINM